MRKSAPLTKLRGANPLRLRRNRPFSTFRDVQHIQVPCASSGDITVSFGLHNLDKVRPSHPLFIWIPPFSHSDGYDPAGLPPPRWLANLPIAVVNYRWAGLYSVPSISKAKDTQPGVLHWPTPLHDVHFGYQWIIQNLAPPDLGRRDIYIYGSYLGASLAASLALTESRAHSPMAVRGLVTYNGIYNWTTVLPGHPIHKTKTALRSRKKPVLPIPDPPPAEPASDSNSPFHLLRRQAPVLFHRPAHLFDPFASPCLFFHTSGLHVPTGWETPSALSTEWIDAINLLAGTPAATTATAYSAEKAPPPRKSYLVFPPRKSTLQIPETLLLYDSPSQSASPGQKRGRGRARVRQKDSFRAQALELAGVMIRSIEMLELKDRMKWDNQYEDPEARVAEAERRVRQVEVETDAGEEDAELGLLDLSGAGERAAEEWLRERMLL